MACSSFLARAGAVGGLAWLLVAGCGGKIEPSGENAQTHGAGPYAGSATTDPGKSGATPPSTPKGVPGLPGAPGAGGRGPTYVNGPIGFVVRDAFSFDTGPRDNRELRGVWLTSFVNACDKRNAVAGAGILRIDFSEEAGSVPPGTYPLEGPTPVDARTAFAQVWWVTAAGCTAPGTPGPHFESGTVTITRSDATGMVGSFQGMLDVEGESLAIDGQFDAPRCPSDGSACTP